MSKATEQSKYRARVIDSTITSYLKVCGALCIEGPKWCGKTWTSSFHSKSEFLVGDPENNFSNRQLAAMSPTLILQGDTPRMIDEWQEVPPIWDAVRAETDRRNKKGQFILTGSSTPKKKGVLHTGTGRIINLRMNTMTLYESGDSKGTVSLKELCDGNLTDKLTGEVSLQDLAYYIVRGGWPGNLDVEKGLECIMPRAYMDNVIKEDLHRLEDFSDFDEHKAALLLRALARNEATTVSDSALLKDISGQEGETLSRNTIAKYLNAMDRLFLFNNQEPFSPDVRSSLRVKQAVKRHFSDPAMAAALLTITPEKLLRDLNTFGFLFEAMAERDLSVYASSFGAKLYHYQDYKNHELDAVIELDGGDWCAFEIKLGAGKIEEGAENLRKTCADIEKNGGRPPKIKCVICGLSNAAYQRPDGVFVVPLTALKM